MNNFKIVHTAHLQTPGPVYYGIPRVFPAYLSSMQLIKIKEHDEMKNRNIIPLPKEEKKKVALTGFLSLPLRVGERAFINHGSHSIMTSTVKIIVEVSAEGVIFETNNTIYSISYATVPEESEVMCA